MRPPGLAREKVALRTIPTHAIRLHEWGTRLQACNTRFSWRPLGAWLVYSG